MKVLFVVRALITIQTHHAADFSTPTTRDQTPSSLYIPRPVLRLHILRKIHRHAPPIQKLLLIFNRHLRKLRVRFTPQPFKQTPILIPNLHDNVEAAGRGRKRRGHAFDLGQIAAREAQYAGQGDVLVEQFGVLGLVVFAECCDGGSRLAFEEADDFKDGGL